MGQVVAKVLRPVRNFNIENRAARALEKGERVPAAAPKHESTKEKISQFREEHPEYMEAVTAKSDALHERLKQIYIDTKDAPIEIRSAVKAPPLSREARPDTDLGVMDVEYEMPPGKTQLKTILSFLGEHQTDPDNITATSIAQAHSLDQADVENVLSHFKVLQIYLPEQMYKENKNLKKIVAKQLKEGAVLQADFKLLGQQAKAKAKEIGSPSTPSGEGNVAPGKS